MGKKQPIWNEEVKIRKREPLNGDLSVEIAIIGAGMTGILTAYFLQKAGKKVAVLEADRIGSGQTGKTTAKITYQHGMCYHNLIQKVGKKETLDYLTANRLAIDAYRQLIQEEKIDCDFRECDSYLYTLEENHFLEKEEKAAISLGIDALITNQTELPFPVKAALRFPGQAAFHPMKFLKHIAEDLTIYEDTKVDSIEDKAVGEHMLLTNRGKINAKIIVIACHFPFNLRPGYYFAKMHQERSYVVALQGVEPIRNLYYGIDEGGYSFRQSGENLLLGGVGHRTGENSLGGQYQQLFAAAGRFYPEGRISHYWSAQDCMTLDDIPYIGRFAKSREDIYVATGFRKWGMTHAMAAARILSEEILWGESSFGKVFRPNRFHGKVSMPNLLYEGAHSIKNLTVPNHEKKIRCAHMGCFLSWNPEESTWDCPCHGSRFTEEGNLIEGPAKKNL